MFAHLNEGEIVVNVAINFNYNGINIFTFPNPLH